MIISDPDCGHIYVPRKIYPNRIMIFIDNHVKIEDTFKPYENTNFYQENEQNKH